MTIEIKICKFFLGLNDSILFHVQRVFFGQYHPSYVKALLHYCLYSSHVGCSTIGVDIAKVKPQCN